MIFLAVAATPGMLGLGLLFMVPMLLRGILDVLRVAAVTHDASLSIATAMSFFGGMLFIWISPALAVGMPFTVLLAAIEAILGFSLLTQQDRKRF